VTGNQDNSPDPPAGRPLVVGLVGGMGSGKSSVAKALERRGAHIIVADTFGHEALRLPDVRERVFSRWGPGLADERGEVDRKKLGAVVFADAGERRALEGFVFPYIERRIAEEIAKARSDPGVPVIVLDAAVMLEAGWDRACDVIAFVDAPRDVRLARLATQRGWTEAELAAREAAQMPLAEKAARADVIVDNAGTPGRLEEQLDRLMGAWAAGRTAPE
jgi:dephospho-CoA kinase